MTVFNTLSTPNFAYMYLALADEGIDGKAYV